MEGDYHFNSSTIMPPESEMLMHQKPNRRKSWGYNAKKAWCIGPCFDLYRSFCSILLSTGGERILDTVCYKHYAIALPDVTPAKRIVQATKSLQDAIRQQPSNAPLNEIHAVQLLRDDMLGKTSPPQPPQKNKPPTTQEQQKLAPAPTAAADEDPQHTATANTKQQQQYSTTALFSEPVPQCQHPAPNVITQDDNNSTPAPPRAQRSKRVKQRLLSQENEKHCHLLNLVANDAAPMPNLTIRDGTEASNGLHKANQHLQMQEWAFQEYFAHAVIDEATGKSLEYRDLIKDEKLKKIWAKSFTNELGRLAQGIREITGTDTIHFIRKEEIPCHRWRDITHGRIVVACRPQKSEPNRSRLTVGGDRVNYPFEVSTPTADLPTIKMLWNSVLSTGGAKFLTMDVANFYLGMPMARPEYMRLPLLTIPDEIVEAYNLKQIPRWLGIRLRRYCDEFLNEHRAM